MTTALKIGIGLGATALLVGGIILVVKRTNSKKTLPPVTENLDEVIEEVPALPESNLPEKQRIQNDKRVISKLTPGGIVSKRVTPAIVSKQKQRVGTKIIVPQIQKMRTVSGGFLGDNLL